MVNTGPMRILIVDDHTVVRRGLKEILVEEFPHAEFGEAEDGPQTLRLIMKQKWDVVVLDITMPGMSGLDVLKNIKNVRPNLPILILSMHPEDQYAMRSLKAGASGYLTKETASEELVKAVKKVRAGGRYISDSLGEALAFRAANGYEGPLHEKLSDREHQVLLMLGSGKTVSEIAEELSLSKQAVSTYRRRILDKMAMKTNADIIRYVMENGLVK
jgi:DNA-binding NarL/FixJ family response regulator